MPDIRLVFLMASGRILPVQSGSIFVLLRAADDPGNGGNRSDHPHEHSQERRESESRKCNDNSDIHWISLLFPGSAHSAGVSSFMGAAVSADPASSAGAAVSAGAASTGAAAS